MAVRNEMGCLVLPQDFSLKQRDLLEFAKREWNNSSLRSEDCIFILSESEKVIAHRKEAYHSFPDCLSVVPKCLKIKLANAIFGTRHGYSQAITFMERCRDALTQNIFYPNLGHKYVVGNFIDPSTGHFDELCYVRHFVSDDEEDPHERYHLAALYCFPNSLRKLWDTMKSYKCLPRQGKLGEYERNYDRLFAMWAYKLENKYEQLMKQDYDYGFNYTGFIEAIAMGHEYAARYFWNRLTDKEKTKFHGELDFGLLTDAAESNSTGLVNFIYSILNGDQKTQLFIYTILDSDRPEARYKAPILCCLLESEHYQTLLNDIIHAPYSFPTIFFVWILNSLSFEISELPLPVNETIFQALWNRLSQEERNEVVETESSIIMNLVKKKAMDLLKIIILPLPHSEKDRMLLNDWQKAGISALDDFSYGNDYDALRRYLLYFIMDCCSEDQTLSFRSDASSVFDAFIKSEDFINLEKRIPDSERNKLNKFIEDFKKSLNHPHLLLQQVE